jgi:hypothetical protein
LNLKKTVSCLEQLVLELQNKLAEVTKMVEKMQLQVPTPGQVLVSSKVPDTQEASSSEPNITLEVKDSIAA